MLRQIIIGVDVGGTNTDAVLVDVDVASQNPASSVLAACKSPTTAQTTDGIISSVKHVLALAASESESESGCEAFDAAEDVLSVNIGTTHFINAVVERDASKLARVAVLRLCGPYVREVPPFAGFPPELRAIIEGHTAYLSGGVEIDGRLIAAIDEDEVRGVAKILHQKRIYNIAIVGVYSPIDTKFQQEDHVKRILLEELGPAANITLSRHVAQIGLLERENASILNAAILPLARRTIREFRQAFRKLNLNVPLFLTQNDGTLITAEQASELPIRTFLSGPTNSLAGAAFLAGVGRDLNEQVLMVDIGGTTSDVCALLPSGFPRQAAAFSELAGVRTNFPLPDICSIGVGGGSLVRQGHNGKVEVGPASVGRQLETESFVFGGGQLTATDITVASGEKTIGSIDLVRHLEKDLIVQAQAQIKRLLEEVVDRMKTSSDPVKVILVGGGSVIAPKDLKGVSAVINPPHANVANAVGAAIAKVSATIDSIIVLDGISEQDALQSVVQEAFDVARKNGAQNPALLEQSAIPVPYMSNPTMRILVRVAGKLSPEKLKLLKSSTALHNDTSDESPEYQNPKIVEYVKAATPEQINILTYKPLVEHGQWKVSKTDLGFISAGCGVLGAGGGGDTHASTLSVAALLDSNTPITIISPSSLTSSNIIPSFAYMGSPTVLSERLPSGSELLSAATASMQSLSLPLTSLTAVMSLEIGGANGLRGLQVAAWLKKPVIDADLMGRAYPNLWQITPTNSYLNMTPAAISDARGATLVQISAVDNRDIETMLRAVCVQMGHAAAISLGQMSGTQVQSIAVRDSLSLAWRLGRALSLSKQQKLDPVTSILEIYHGQRIFRGKITSVSRRVDAGFTKGSVIIAPYSGPDADVEQTDLLSDKEEVEGEGALTIDFQNENIRAYTLQGTRAVVPDIITVLDAGDGRALGTQDYRYGLRVEVVALVGAPQWTEGNGLINGGVEAFGLKEDYVPVAKYRAVRSVIEEFGT